MGMLPQDVRDQQLQSTCLMNAKNVRNDVHNSASSSEGNSSVCSVTGTARLSAEGLTDTEEPTTGEGTRAERWKRWEQQASWEQCPTYRETLGSLLKA